MDLGAFSISLNVRDLEASSTFYEKLGFSAFGGDPAQNWLILKNGSTIIGLFQGMFEKNSLTFNPGWNSDAAEVNPFTDVRDIRRSLEEQGIEVTADISADSGPASLTLTDPDGNPVLIDQHR